VRTRVLYAVAWALAATAAIGVGVATVATVGDAVRGRGPLGSDVRQADRAADRAKQPARPDPSAAVVTRDISRDFGTFVVSCQGVYAIGVEARPARAGGWRMVRYEPGPDDDVEAVFRDRRQSVDVEVFCDDGHPTVAEIERSRLPDDD
jgi:hypothetical protein